MITIPPEYQGQLHRFALRNNITVNEALRRWMLVALDHLAAWEPSGGYEKPFFAIQTAGSEPHPTHPELIRVTDTWVTQTRCDTWEEARDALLKKLPVATSFIMGGLILGQSFRVHDRFWRVMRIGD